MNWNNLGLLTALGIAASAQAAGPTAEIGGSWTSSCFPFRTVSQTEILRFHADGRGEIDRTIYADNACSQPLYRVHEDVAYAVGGALRERGAMGDGEFRTDLFHLDLNILTVTLTALTAEGQVQFESQSYCGMERWPLGEAVSVIGKKCTQSLGGESFSESYHNYGEPAYTSFAVRDSQLLIAFPVGTLATERPLTLPRFGYRPL